MTNGGKHAVYNTCATLLNPGDEVLLPAPYWTTYPEPVALAGGTAVVLPTDEAAGFRVTVDQLEAARTDRPPRRWCSSRRRTRPARSTRPTRSRAIGEWAVEHGIWVITDEIYEHLTYGEHRFSSMPTLVPELADTCVVLNGVAKTYAMTGWRVGWMIGPADVIKAATNLQSHSTSNVANVSQRAALAAVAGDLDAVATMRAAFDRRRRTIHRLLNEIPGVSCLEPQGAFYAFPSFEGVLGRELRGHGPGPPSSWPSSSSSRSRWPSCRARPSPRPAMPDSRSRWATTTSPKGSVASASCWPRPATEMPDERPYGSWPSPVSASMVVAGAVGLADAIGGADGVWWSELRPEQGGRVAVVRHTPGDGTVELFGDEFSARTRVHEYGGGAWWIHDETLFFANWADQRLYRVEPDGEPGVYRQPVSLTPEPAEAHGDRYADGTLAADGAWVICVRERHGHGHPEPANEIVAIDAWRGGEPVVLVAGPDFVAAPRVSPDGTRLAWLQWNHPDMPWDGTELWVATLDTGEVESTPSGKVIALRGAVLVAGSREESLTQPEWGPDGDLWFTSDADDWWNLRRVAAADLPDTDLPEGVPASPAPASRPPAVAVVPIEGDIGLPAWVFGQRRFAFLDDGRVAVAYARDGVDHLAVLEPDTGRVEEVEAGFSALTSLHPFGHGLVFVGGSADAEPVVAVADLPPGGPASIAVLRSPRRLGIDPAWFSRPQSLEVATSDGAVTHALYYAPTNPQVVGPNGQAPPLVVMSHGGPTSAARPQLSLATQYWTSRGFAVVDVNYRGSTGFGRRYRKSLDGGWGVVDVDDCVEVADELAARGLADPARLIIRGGSAGGYTTLCALAFRDRFRAGASLYGVADLEALARDTHKFESRYLDSLVGPLPTARDRLPRALAHPSRRRLLVPAHRLPGPRGRGRPAVPVADDRRRGPGQRPARGLPGLRGGAARVPPGGQHPAGAGGRAVLLRRGVRLRALRSRGARDDRQPLSRRSADPSATDEVSSPRGALEGEVPVDEAARPDDGTGDAPEPLTVIAVYRAPEAADQAAKTLVAEGIGSVVDPIADPPADGTDRSIGVAVVAVDVDRARRVLGIEPPDDSDEPDAEQLRREGRSMLIPVLLIGLAMVLIPLVAFFISFKASGG